jgi:two-component system OmpR family sensor kinase
MSLRTRLLIAICAVVVVALGAVNLATYSALHSFLYGRVDQTLETTRLAVQRTILHPPGPDPAAPGSLPGKPPELPDSLTSLAPGTFVQVRDSSGRPLEGETQPAFVAGGEKFTPTVPKRVSGLASQAAEQRGTNATAGSVTFSADSRQARGPQFRVLVSVLPSGDQLVVAVPLTETLATLHRLLAIELMVTAAALVAAGMLGWWLVCVGLRPLRDVERTAEAIAEGNLHERVPDEDTRTEVGRLGHAFNVMLGRIQEAFAARDATEAELRASEERLRRFVADASHELRTPLAAVSAYAELLEGGAVQRRDDLERVMHGIRDESARMKTLVDDLLLLARLDEGRPLARASLELVGLAAEAVATAQAVGADWPVHLEADRPLEIVGDRERLRQVIDNLLGNVRTHTPAGTATVIRLSESDGSAVLEVADSGPGLSNEQVAHVFERFYRTDGSRSRTDGPRSRTDGPRSRTDGPRSRIHGGAGLGLSIVAAIVAAHGGSVSAANGVDGGAVFTVRLPLAPDPSAPADARDAQPERQGAPAERPSAPSAES